MLPGSAISTAKTQLEQMVTTLLYAECRGVQVKCWETEGVKAERGEGVSWTPSTLPATGVIAHVLESVPRTSSRSAISIRVF